MNKLWTHSKQVMRQTLRPGKAAVCACISSLLTLGNVAIAQQEAIAQETGRSTTPQDAWIPPGLIEHSVESSGSQTEIGLIEQTAGARSRFELDASTFPQAAPVIDLGQPSQERDFQYVHEDAVGLPAGSYTAPNEPTSNLQIGELPNAPSADEAFSTYYAEETEPRLTAPVESAKSELPWWTLSVSSPMRDVQSLPVDLDQLFALTVSHSGRVLSVAQTPWLNRALADQAAGVFDPTLYTDGRFDSTSDPVENTLTTGGPPRLEDDVVSLETGLRGTTKRGTTYNLGQRLGHKNSNSEFFRPNDQASSRLFANLTKPLLQGRRIDVNRSLILTTQFDTRAAQAAYHQALQRQLAAVAEAYWSLVFERASLLQRERHLSAAVEIAEQLENRVSHDSTRSQILRARAAVSSRRAEIAQADARIRNLESQVRALVNAPELLHNRSAELVPMQVPAVADLQLDTEAAIAEALMLRPELEDLAFKAKAAQVRIRLARDQSRPRLDLIAEGYIAGLDGESDIGTAWGNQFTEGRPGFATGLSFQRPVNNQVAKATLRQRHLELAQIRHLVTEANETIRAEVETAVRNVYAARDAANLRFASWQSVVAEVAYLQDRWLTLADDPRFGQIQLDELLRAQDRLLQEEQNLLTSRVQFSRALLELQRATGSLIRFAH